MSKIKKILGTVVHGAERFDYLAERLAALHQMIDALEAKDRITQERLDEATPEKLMDRICEDRNMLSRLNRGLSISPTVWGDPSRLEIDETAAVFTCFFNVNSGKIKVGESTFAGSGVSLLAGSHDPRLTGFLRKDSEKTEGCDIEIGKGVWLCSGCTVLGPCRIGDDAVIAAGAVVIPGSEVPAGEIWGGVPAKRIGQVDGKAMAPENPAVQEAFARSEGILYADGWGERTPGILKEPGHWMCKEEAGIITDRKEWKVGYRREGWREGKIAFEGPEGETVLSLPDGEGEATVCLPIEEGTLSAVRLKRTGGRAFMAFSCNEVLGRKNEEFNNHEQLTNHDKPTGDNEGKLDIERIMEEIRAEARKKAPYEEEVGFEQVSGEEPRKAERLREQVEKLTEDYEVPVSYADPSRNPLKRIYKKMMTKAAHCATAPMSVRATEVNLAMKTALEKAVEVIEEQEKRISELEKSIRK